MTETARTNSYQPTTGQSRIQCTDEGLGTKKTVFVLFVVVGCFAVLWPKLLYPMLVSSAQGHIKPNPSDTGCCDVISEVDVDTIKIMSELCSTIIDHSEGSLSNKNIVSQCRKAVLETCGIDISAALQDRISLGHSTKQILEEVRSLNGSLCLKYHFGLSPWKLGVPHRVNVKLDHSASIRQERSAHLRPGIIHPAFRERGRAIPETGEAPRFTRRPGPPPKIIEGRPPGPIPGMRMAMGGPGHVVPPSKQTNYGAMGILMPIYTVGFVIFFTYTVMRLVFKKKPEQYDGAPLYPPCDSDPNFRQEVFDPNLHYFNRPKDTSKVVVNAMAALLDEVSNEINAHKNKKMPTHAEDDDSIEQKEIRANGSLPKDDQGSVTVMGMETTECSESGKKWSRPESPVLPHPQPKEPSPPPQQIFLDTALPPQSQILVADSATETEKDEENDSSVVLAGKMTLSVISSDSETGTEDSGGSSGSRKSSSDEKNTISASSSHISEGFEKISAADLEDQIESIIEEATDNVLVVRAEENESNNVLKDILEEELKRLDDTLLEVQNVESNLDPLEANIKEEIPTDVAQSLSEDTLLITFEALKEPQDSTMEASQIGKSATSQTQGFLDVEAIEIAQSKEIDDELTAIKAQENLPINALLLKDDIVPPGDEVDDQLIKSNSESLQTSQENPPVTSLLVTPEVMKGNADSLDENYVVDQESIKEIDNAAVALLPEDNLSSLSKEQDATSFLEESLLDNKPNTIQPTRHFRLGEPTVEEILRNELEMAENQAATVKENDNLPCEEKSTVVKSSELNNVQPEISLDEVLPEPDELQPVLDVEELVIEDIVYHDEDSEDEDYDEDERETNVNGMSDIADNDELEDEDIEEVIEYVENTDEEGEEIVEVNANGEIDR